MCGNTMTVKKLRDKLSAMDPNADVAASLEDETGIHFFDISDIYLRAGTSVRNEGGKVSFTFAHDGREKWAFISIETP